MNQIKLNILKNGGSIFYTDTDSLVIDEIGWSWLEVNGYIGYNLGQFKLEHSILKAYFISNKTYCLVTEVLDSNNINSVFIKAKGVDKNDLSLTDFIIMYTENKCIQTIKQNTITNYPMGSVKIENKDVILNWDVYTKRKKIYNSIGLWINTEPLFLYLNK
jgi:hypothetical protein